MKKLLFTITICLFSLSLLSQSCLPEGIIFTTQEQIDNFQTNNPGCVEIEGDVAIGGSDIVNLDGLNVVTSIGGHLWLQGNNSLTGLSGLNGLTSVGDDLKINNNHELSNLIGLSNLTSIGDDIRINYNNALTSLIGLDNVTSIDGDLDIQFNLGLTSLTGLDYVTSISGHINIVGNSSLTSMIGLGNLTSATDLYIFDNDALTSLIGLDNVGSTEDFLTILQNDELISLTGLDGMTAIGGNLNIGSNTSLGSVMALSSLTEVGGDVNINNNAALSNLTGLGNIAAESISNLYINDNSSLSTCEVQSVCDFLANPNGTIGISNNDEGCNSQEEVQEACYIVSNTDFQYKDKIIVSPNPFTTSTTIEYELKQSEKVTLTIYDYLGKQVYQVQENQPLGTQQLIWNAEGYADGVYYYRLKAGDAVANGKLLKVR